MKTFSTVEETNEKEDLNKKYLWIIITLAKKVVSDVLTMEHVQ